MKSFKWPLLILILLTGLALAGYFAGLFPNSPSEDRAIRVTLEHDGANSTLRIRLADTDARTHWHKSSDRYRVDIRRRGPDLYRFDIALLAADSDIARSLRGAARLKNGTATLGGFSYDNQQGHAHQTVVLELQ